MFSPIPVISEASHAIIDTNTNEYLPCMKIFIYVELTILQYVTFVVTTVFLHLYAHTLKVRDLPTDLCCPKENAKQSAISRERNS